MKRTRAHARTAGPAENGRNIRAPTITTLGRVVGEQIEAGGDEIDKLKLSHRFHPHQARATRRPDDRGLGNRRIDHSPGAKLIDEPISHLKSAAIRADVFADNKHRRVAFHLFPNALADRLDERRRPTARRSSGLVFLLVAVAIT